MQQTATLSPSDRTAVEVSLARMTGDAFGALATLPLLCLGELPSSDPSAAVLAHYDVWRSCLIVVREVTKADGGATESSQPVLIALMETLADLRDSYLKIQASHSSAPDVARAAYQRLESAYQRIPQLVREFGDALELETFFLPGPNSLKALAHDRSLRWLGMEIGARPGGGSPER